MLKEEKEEILHFWETRMKMFSEDTLGTGRMSELRSRSVSFFILIIDVFICFYLVEVF